MTKQYTLDQINTFKHANDWNTRMSKGGLDSFSNYGGPDHTGEIMIISRSRDADILEESNFHAAVKLMGKSKHVQILSFGHWACGWIETLVVNRKAPKKLIERAMSIKDMLAEYPVLDDNDYHEREHEAQHEFADDIKDQLADALAHHFKLERTTELETLAYDLNMTCQAYYGNDSCINVYENRPIEAYDLKQLKTCIKDMEYNSNNKSEVFKKLKEALS